MTKPFTKDMLMISVVIPVFNKLSTIRHTLDNLIRAIENSEFKNSYEVLAVDDGSTDGSGEILAHYLSPKVKVFHKANEGPSAARNMGISMSSGKYVLFLDADDIIYRSYFSFLKDAFLKFPDKNAFASNYNEIDFSEVEAAIANPLCYDGKAFIKEDFYCSWLSKPFLFTSTVCINRIFLAKNEIDFPEGKHSGEDQYVWFKVNDLDRFVVTNSACVSYVRNVTNALTSVPVCQIGPHVDYLNEQLGKTKEHQSYCLKKLFRKLVCNVVAANLRQRQFRKALEVALNYRRGLLSLSGILRIALSFASPSLYRSLRKAL